MLVGSSDARSTGGSCRYAIGEKCVELQVHLVVIFWVGDGDQSYGAGLIWLTVCHIFGSSLSLARSGKQLKLLFIPPYPVLHKFSSYLYEVNKLHYDFLLCLAEAISEQYDIHYHKLVFRSLSQLMLDSEIVLITMPH